MVYCRLVSQNTIRLKLHIQQFLILLAVITTVASCSRKKNTLINRNFHAVTTEFNTLYNGDVALAEGKEQIVSSFEDNYWEVLPVEKLEFDEDAFLTTKQENPSFAKAEEKAIKAIRKHSMKINGKEVNPQIDEAFMVLGKARYYDQRYVSSLEAFNYILAFYPASNNVQQANIWKAKANIRLDNNEVAIQSLSRLKGRADFKGQDRADATAIMAQAYLNIDSTEAGLALIKEARELTKKNEEKGRYSYIKAQLYERTNDLDSAAIAYDEVIDLNRKIPRKYWINAQLAKILNLDYAVNDTTELWEHIVKIRNNREHRPYLDKVYYTIANHYTKLEMQDSAVALHNRSLRENSNDKYLISRNYLALGEYSFDNAQYQIAGAYYDSTMAQLPERSRERRSINKKRENLNDVIEYELLATRNDSILTVVAMTEPERRAYYEDHITKLKAKAEKDSIAAAVAQVDIKNNEFFKSNQANGAAGNARRDGGTVGQFYFYNTTAAAFGKQAFEKRWGKRKLEDNWRRSTKGNVLDITNLSNQGAEEATAIEGLAAYNIDLYLDAVPTEQKSIDSLKQDRDFAYFQLGLIYKEKFKENELAIDKLERLLTFKPSEGLVLPSKYNLYQLYAETEATAKANAIKTDITSNYADSRYADILNNPNAVLERDSQSPEVLYENAYKAYSTGGYLAALAELDDYIERFYGDPYLPKFELLRARVIGRLDGVEAYKEALNNVALTYPRVDEGKMAQDLIDTAVPQLKFVKFQDEGLSSNFKMLYTFKTSERSQAEALRSNIQAALKAIKENRYRFTIDTYDRETLFLVGHDIVTPQEAERLVNNLANPPQVETEASKKRRAKYKKRKPKPVMVDLFIPITAPAEILSSQNYSSIQIHKNIAAYREAQTN